MVNRNVVGPHGSMHLFDQGEGIPLLLVHGFPLDHTMWLSQRSLSDCCRVLTPDLRGFGRSCSGPREMTMRQMADDLAGLLDVLSITQPIVLGGLSMGGYVALQFWQAYRERLAGLILCDTRAAADAPEVAAGREVAAERAVREGVAAVADEMLPRLFAGGTLPQDSEVVDRTRQMIARTSASTFAAAQRGMAGRPDMRTQLSAIAQPTLVLCGQDDQITPAAEMRALAAAMPNARYEEIAGAGHLAPLEQSQRVNAAIRRFLAELG